MNTNLTEIVVVMDRSGSMNKVRDDVIGGFNSFVDDQSNCEGEARLTLVQFSSSSDIICDGVPLLDVYALNPETYCPSGWTAMLDAIITTIDNVGSRLAETPEDDRPGKVIFVIITDGDENFSKRYPAPLGYTVCKDRITHQTDVYGWEFIFLAANQDAVLKAGQLGVKANFSKTYTPTSIGTVSVYRGSSEAVKALREGGGDEAVTNALLAVE
jgi:hypothetical protein